MKTGRKGLSQATKERIWEVRAEGLNDAQVATRLGLEPSRVTRYLLDCGGIRPRPRRRARRCLSAAEREEISRGIAAGCSARQIGARLGRSHTTIAREISRSGGRHRYRALFADEEAWRRARRPKPGKLELCETLREIVAERLAAKHSPEQIAGWLAARYPDNERMRVSHETIYRSLYVQSRGSLRRELTAHLRSGRAKRRPRNRTAAPERRGQIPGMVMISERPAEVADRAVPGHWEGDLLIGTKTNAIATLVERRTRYTQLVALPKGIGAESVCEALTASIATLPSQLRRSLTWDQGKEMSQHRRFSVQSGLDVYFCDPRSPWQRGTNENTNGLLRQYFPKRTDFAQVSHHAVACVQDKLNERPRRRLGYRTPAEVIEPHLRCN